MLGPGSVIIRPCAVLLASDWVLIVPGRAGVFHGAIVRARGQGCAVEAGADSPALLDVLTE